MPISVTTYETILLQAMFITTSILCLLSLLLIVFLIFRRLFIQHKNKYVARREQIIKTYLYARITSPIELQQDEILTITDSDYPIVVKLSLDILRSLNIGSESKRMITALKGWGTLDYLKNVINNSSRPFKVQILTLLQYFPADDANQVFLKYIYSKDIYIQMAALNGLATHKSVQHMKHIVNSITNLNKTNKIMLAEVLSRLGSQCVPSLITLLETTASKEIKITTIMALGYISSGEATDKLISMLTTENDDEICGSAISALADIGSTKVTPHIIKCINSDSDIIRLRAVKALGVLQDTSAIPSLVKCLDDNNWWIRFRAAEAIYNFGNKGITILSALCNTNNNAGIIAKQILLEKEAL